MRLIDADALVWKIKTEKGGTPAMLVAVNSIPTVDAVPVVRCEECAHNCGRVDGYICCDKTKEISIWHSEDWYCADGERREE